MRKEKRLEITPECIDDANVPIRPLFSVIVVFFEVCHFVTVNELRVAKCYDIYEINSLRENYKSLLARHAISPSFKCAAI